MLTVLSVVIYAVVVLIAVLLVALILVQPSKGGGLGSAFSGVGEGVFGAQAMGHLAKITVVLIALFFVLTLGLAIISGHNAKGKNATEGSLIAGLEMPVAPETETKITEPLEVSSVNPDAEAAVPVAATPEEGK